MLTFLHKPLPEARITAIEAGAIAQAEAGDPDAAFDGLKDLRRAQRRQREAALSLIRIVDNGNLSIDQSLALLEDVERHHRDDPAIIGLIGATLEQARDIDMLNAAPPDHPIFERVLLRLQDFAEAEKEVETLRQVLSGLSTTARLMSRQRDDVAEAAYRRLIELFPDSGSDHYNYGLFLKTRGRFEEGVTVNLKAKSLTRETVEAYEWNLGICATGAGNAEVALETWLGMGQKIGMGRFGLPEGGYPPCKVRLSERPLAERGADSDDPGLEETIWIERLSPCHGIVRSVLFHDLGVDYGDAVLTDGAPITYHRYGDDEVPVFPHLATITRGGYRFFAFAGTQREPRQLEQRAEPGGDDIVVYSHTENFRVVCSSCFRDADLDHAQHDQEDVHVVTGRIAVAPGIPPQAALHRLDSLYAETDGCRLYSPELCSAAGDQDRLGFDERRYAILAGAASSTSR